MAAVMMVMMIIMMAISNLPGFLRTYELSESEAGNVSSAQAAKAPFNASDRKN